MFLPRRIDHHVSLPSQQDAGIGPGQGGVKISIDETGMAG